MGYECPGSLFGYGHYAGIPYQTPPAIGEEFYPSVAFSSALPNTAWFQGWPPEFQEFVYVRYVSAFRPP